MGGWLGWNPPPPPHFGQAILGWVGLCTEGAEFFFDIFRCGGWVDGWLGRVDPPTSLWVRPMLGCPPPLPPMVKPRPGIRFLVDTSTELLLGRGFHCNNDNGLTRPPDVALSFALQLLIVLWATGVHGRHVRRRVAMAQSSGRGKSQPTLSTAVNPVLPLKNQATAASESAVCGAFVGCWIGRQCGVQVKAVFACPTAVGASPPPPSPSNVWGGRGRGGGRLPRDSCTTCLCSFSPWAAQTSSFRNLFF